MDDQVSGRVGTPSPTRAHGRMRVVLGLVAALALAGVGFQYWRSPAPPVGPGAGAAGQGAAGAGAGRSRQAPATSVSIGTVTKGDITVTVRALGTVTSISTVTLRPQVSGQLQSVNFTEGQAVRKGDLLAVIDPRPFQAVLAQAQAQLDRDKALLAGAKVDFDRYQGLSAQNAVPRQTLDTQKALVAQYTATVEADKATVETASINLGFTQIRAPVDGRAGLRLVDQGNYVTPGDTTGIVVLTQLKPISVVFSVPEDRLAEISRRLRDGAQLKVHAFDRTGQTRIAEGVLRTFDSQIDQTTGTIKLRADFPNDDLTLYPNQFVNVILDVDVHAGVAIAPTAGIQRGVPGTYVYLLNADQTVSLRPVTLGISAGEQVEILSGLVPGDRIVVEGTDRLRDGATVNVRAPVPEGAPAAGGPGAPGKAGRKPADEGRPDAGQDAADGAGQSVPKDAPKDVPGQAPKDVPGRPRADSGQTGGAAAR
ncbi:efflux RND transporter periplasmic adaptor subunit [Xanthobacter autotrophicus DSM 431]|uniref:efflux RND transporter periplasmic adaptor subunit n=1 Tax=Xanthobacter nonsaccharivorans TaxID=3119912 RepID=UPI00372A248D